jgi:hypothetical protein
MADLREVFPILQDAGTGAGEAPISRIEGEAAAAQEGLIGFSFKDSSGNVVLPQLTAEGKILVDTEALGGSCIYDSGSDPAPVVSTASDLVTIVATLGKSYNNIMMQGSCLRSSLFELVHIDDVGVTDTETTLGHFLVGPGQFSFCCSSLCKYYDTTGGTGVQNFVLRGTNLFHASTLRAELAVNELDAT